MLFIDKVKTYGFTTEKDEYGGNAKNKTDAVDIYCKIVSYGSMLAKDSDKSIFVKTCKILADKEFSKSNIIVIDDLDYKINEVKEGKYYIYSLEEVVK